MTVWVHDACMGVVVVVVVVIQVIISRTTNCSLLFLLVLSLIFWYMYEWTNRPSIRL